jgi:hypothetical protein
MGRIFAFGFGAIVAACAVAADPAVTKRRRGPSRCFVTILARV